jgi:hypothetical protein
MNKISISFFELMFLVEACIPPQPIARTMFWDRLSAEIYHKLTPEERNKMFNKIINHSNFNLADENCLLFFDRFNPKNQYEVVCKENQVIKCFFHKNNYHVRKGTKVDEKAILEVKNLY